MKKFATVASCFVIVFTVVGLFVWRHQLSPSGNGATMNHAAHANVPATQPMVPVNIPTFTPTGLQGERLFNSNCAACHGANAAGQDGIAPPLIHKLYEPSHHNNDSFYRAAAKGVIAHHLSLIHI